MSCRQEKEETARPQLALLRQSQTNSTNREQTCTQGKICPHVAGNFVCAVMARTTQTLDKVKVTIKESTPQKTGVVRNFDSF